MKNKKRLLAAILAGLFAVSAMAGCSNNSKKTDGTTQEATQEACIGAAADFVHGAEFGDAGLGSGRTGAGRAAGRL